ncbi:uncharacterized protein CMC5_059240 [Chondromyces crocatus]|uniref:PDZ domain-containing protein n=1 Tax=Chondromyces crocatus TaxID=52 RepID=A0A0K1EM69_CHOCO|nr:uncharacterized protein CMC5_059240 [Chondromyces crocatus]
MAEGHGGRASILKRLRRQPPLLVGALLVPVLLLPLVTRALTDAVAARSGAQLAILTERLSSPPSPSLPSLPAIPASAQDDESPRDALASERLQPVRPAARGSTAPKPGASSSPSADSGKPGLPRALHIRIGTVLRAARSGARPSGTPVPALGDRPAGLALQGVGHFGAGLLDGDILTHVSGAPARSVNTVVGAVMGALRAGAPALGAVVWRGDQPIQVSVELPRLSADSLPSAGSAPPPAPTAAPRSTTVPRSASTPSSKTLPHATAAPRSPPPPPSKTAPRAATAK